MVADSGGTVESRRRVPGHTSVPHIQGTLDARPAPPHSVWIHRQVNMSDASLPTMGWVCVAEGLSQEDAERLAALLYFETQVR